VTQPPPSALAHDPLSGLPDHFYRQHAALAALHSKARELRDDPRVLRSSLELLRSDRAMLKAVARRSYQHANGFAKIVLHEGGGYRVRLHVWQPKPPDYGADTNPHGHRWEFASWIVVGVLREEIFAEAASGRRHRRFAYHGTPDLHPAGEAALRRMRTIERRAGDVYGRGRGVVHTVSPAMTDLVVTLVLQGPTDVEPTPVYQPRERGKHAETRLTLRQLRSVLDHVVTAL
jgi:hypothetical protein